MGIRARRIQRTWSQTPFHAYFDNFWGAKILEESPGHGSPGTYLRQQEKTKDKSRALPQQPLLNSSLGTSQSICLAITATMLARLQVQREEDSFLYLINAMPSP